MRIEMPDTDFEAFAKHMGHMIASSELHYLELTDRWEWFGEWQAERRGADCYCVDHREIAFSEDDPANETPYCKIVPWPPRNIVLLGRASTQEELDLLSMPLRWHFRQDWESLKGTCRNGWRTAIILAPTEELRLDALFPWDYTDSDGARYHVPPAVEQIIVKPPDFDDELQTLTREYIDSIISQVQEIREECENCGGTVGDWPCIQCSATGLAPGKPLLWVEGTKYQERLEEKQMRAARK